MLIRFAFVVLIMALTRAVACSAKQGQANPSTAKPGTLQWQAELAKAHGKNSIEVASQPGPSDQGHLDEALPFYTVVKAVPMSTIVQPTEDTILTWYKFRVITVFSKATKCEPCAAAPSIPPELLPLWSDEIAVFVEGGTATVDGVVITVRAGSPHFEIDRTYLLVLGSLEGSNQVALLGGSPSWAFRIDEQGKLYRTTTSKKISPLLEDVMSLGNVDLVEKHIRAAKPSAGLRNEL